MIWIFLSVLAFTLSLFTFFSGDDWAVLKVASIHSFQEFTNFFSFVPNAQSLTFYRPLPQQVFFSVFNQVFGLNAFPYHLFVLICFGLSLFLLYRLSRKLNFSKFQANLSVLIYGVAVANFARLYFLSAFQDVLLPLFVLATLIAFLDKKYFWSVLFFVFSLMSKETAVVTPFILLGLVFLTKKVSFKTTLPYFAITAIYLFFRLKYFGGAVGDSYIYDFSIKKTFNTFFWYVIWTLGAPETLVDYVSSGLRIVPKFFTDFREWSGIILIELGSLFAFLTLSLVLLRRKILKSSRLILFCLFIFLISLAPVIFMPWHKFTHALSLPMIGSSLLLGSLFADRRVIFRIFLIIYIITNLSMNYFLYHRHYSINRSRISANVFQYFSKYYPQAPVNSIFVFTNNKSFPNQGINQSKEISLALSRSDFFKVFYQDQKYTVFYEDLDKEIPTIEKVISIDSSVLLNY